MKNTRRPLYDADHYLASATQRLAAHHVLRALDADFSARLAELVKAMGLDPQEADALTHLWRETALNARVQLSPHVSRDTPDHELAEALCRFVAAGRETLS